jgi:catechol 2,3-dioxygenase
MRVEVDAMSIYHAHDVLHFTKITLLVLQLKRSLDFYEHVLGLRRLFQDKNVAHLGVNDCDTLIELIEDPLAKPLGITQGLYHYALLLPSRRSLASVIKRLIDHRYPVSGASDHGVSEAIYLDDPDGHGIELYVDKPKSDWPESNGQLDMYTKALDLNPIMSELKEDASEMMDEKTILGHLHFHVHNLKLAESFYAHVLGFKVMLNYQNSALFIADQGYHHHLGLNIWQGDAPLNQPRQIGLKAYVLHVPKEHYLHVLKRLNEAHIALMDDDGITYVIDPLQQKLIFHFET